MVEITRRLSLAALIAPAAAKATGAWRIVTEYPASAIAGEGVAFFAETVTRMAQGALVVTPGFDAPDGLRSAGMLRAVAEGRVQAADAFTGALAGEAAIFQLSALPFLTASTADTERLWKAAEPAYTAALKARGLVPLFVTPWPATGLWSRIPLTGPGALAALRVRTYDAASTSVFRAAGAAPVQISFADALPRLRAGELDAVLSSGDGGAGARLWELLPHFTVLNYASPLSLAFCSKAALDAVPEALAATVARAGAETTRRQFAALATRLVENETRMRANGVTIAPSPAVHDLLSGASAAVISEWSARAGPEGVAILTEYRKR